MRIGKLPNETLDKVIISNINNKRKEVLIGAGIGEDNAIIDFGKDVCVLSTDPITGASKDLGKLAVHISCNDVAASGGEPIGVLLTIMAPVTANLDDIKQVMEDAGRAAEDANIQIIGGHTEVTDAVNRMVVSTTVVGKQRKDKVLRKENIQVGDKILISKYAGIEGTSILAKERLDRLEGELSKEEIDYAQNMDKDLSVIREGWAAGDVGVHYMHDITEGGVLGAVWEAGQAVGKGIVIDESLIPVEEVTRKICKILDLDPYRLISSGSMLIVACDNKVKEIKERLGELNIKVTVIGEVTEGKNILIKKNNREELVAPPASDELYKGLK